MFGGLKRLIYLCNGRQKGGSDEGLRRWPGRKSGKRRSADRSPRRRVAAARHCVTAFRCEADARRLTRGRSQTGWSEKLAARPCAVFPHSLPSPRFPSPPSCSLRPFAVGRPAPGSDRHRPQRAMSSGVSRCCAARRRRGAHAERQGKFRSCRGPVSRLPPNGL